MRRSRPASSSIPVLNKVDLPGAEPERVTGEIVDLLGGDPAESPADLGEDRRGRPRGPRGDRRADPGAAWRPATPPPRALIFDSEFDQYRGVVAFVRVVRRRFRKGEQIRAMQAGTEAEIDEIGFFAPDMTRRSRR